MIRIVLFRPLKEKFSAFSEKETVHAPPLPLIISFLGSVIARNSCSFLHSASWIDSSVFNIQNAVEMNEDEEISPLDDTEKNDLKYINCRHDINNKMFCCIFTAD